MDLSAVIATLVDDKVTALVNVLQLFGLYVVVYVYFSLRTVKSRLTYTGLAPEYERLLTDHASKISDYLNDYEGNLTSLRKEVASVEVRLSGFKRQLPRYWWPWGEAVTTNRVLGQVRAFETSASRDTAYEIYLGIHKILLEIEDRKRNAIWRQS